MGLASQAAGSFEDNPVQSLGRLLAEPDAAVRREKLSARGLDDGFIDVLEKSFGFCKRAIQLYPDTRELCVSFNGGKDACVVLYLWLAAVEAVRLSEELPPAYAEPHRQPALFFDSPDEFDEVRDFVAWVSTNLSLDEMMLEGKSFRIGMKGLVNEGLRAVVMGQRRGDPWMKNVDVFSPSTEGWPAFMRINPIIDWSYSNVWTFLQNFQLPYCVLYNDGYTSLGSRSSTFRNPALLLSDGSYAPAYELQDGELERDGRFTRQVTEEEKVLLAEEKAVNKPAVDGKSTLEAKNADIAASKQGGYFDVKQACKQIDAAG